MRAKSHRRTPDEDFPMLVDDRRAGWFKGLRKEWFNGPAKRVSEFMPDDFSRVADEAAEMTRHMRRCGNVKYRRWYAEKAAARRAVKRAAKRLIAA